MNVHFLSLMSLKAMQKLANETLRQIRLPLRQRLALPHIWSYGATSCESYGVLSCRGFVRKLPSIELSIMSFQGSKQLHRPYDLPSSSSSWSKSRSCRNWKCMIFSAKRHSRLHLHPSRMREFSQEETDRQTDSHTNIETNKHADVEPNKHARQRQTNCYGIN